MPRHSHHTAAARAGQAPLPAADLWATEVVPHLPPDLDAQARVLGAFTRRRAIASATDLLRAVLAMVLVATSLQHLGAWAVCTAVADISAPAWHKRLGNCRAWLQWLLAELLAPPLPPVRLIPQADGNIILVDATRFGQVGGTGDDWRWHTAYNFTAGRLVHVTVTDQHGGEHLGHYRIQPGDIIVADSGYGYRRSVATVKKHQADLVGRVRPSTFPVETAGGQVVDVVAALRKRGPTVREWLGWCTDHDGERYQVRLIAAKLPPSEARAARRRAIQNAKKRGRPIQPDTLLVAGWVLVITTLPATRWDATAVLRLYRVRWQVELVFKRMKSILRLGTLRARTARSIEVYLLGVLIAWALQETEARWVRQVLSRLDHDHTLIPSSWQLTTLSVDVLCQQVRGGWGQARVHACLPHLQRFLTSRVRNDRVQQETTARAWLAQRPQPSIQIHDLEAMDLAA